MNSFKAYHPIVNFAYFTFVILFSMFFMHPVCLSISLVCSFVYSILLNGKKALKFNFLYMLPMLTVSALMNFFLNHEGITIMSYLPDGNPLTLESAVYGIAAATMIVTAICWFSCYNAVMTSDKFIYLFGRIIPSLSLVLSMVLRFVPKFKEQIRIISDSQSCIGRDASSGGVLKRTGHGVKILSIMLTWTLENAIETADSMKSRGYGLHGRTSFSVYTLDKRDIITLSVMVLMAAYVIVGKLCGGLNFRYYPSMQAITVTGYSVSVFAAYFMLCIMPVTIEIMEERKWKAIKSSI